MRRHPVTCGRARDTTDALKALTSAADHGFSDSARIEPEAGFENLRSDPRSARVLDVVRKNKKSS
jgi:hypothetical protein